MERDQPPLARGERALISTHALTWSATYAPRYGDGVGHFDFNSRAHVERDRNSHTRGGALRYFNSRAHVERDYNVTKKKKRKGNFNSRAHVERDKSGIKIDGAHIISTHALTWSATVARYEMLPDEGDFNSRAHVERDRGDHF